MGSKVFFTRSLAPEKVVEAYQKLGIELSGKVAVKIHSGEKGNQNYLTPEFWKPMVDFIHGTIVECNTAYGDATGGVRDNTESHLKLLEEHGWTRYFDVDLMDAEGPDAVWPIPNGKVLKENHVGKNILNYDSLLVLAHFKGHPMGGYGGALKQRSTLRVKPMIGIRHGRCMHPALHFQRRWRMPLGAWWNISGTASLSSM